VSVVLIFQHSFFAPFLFSFLPAASWLILNAVLPIVFTHKPSLSGYLLQLKSNVHSSDFFCSIALLVLHKQER
jgi:hypothetical protein